jgi:hypothetical protein
MGATKWKDVGVNIKHEVSAYTNQAFTCDEYHAYVVDAGKNTLPFLEWVKTAKCQHCGKTGHIRPMCPQYIDDIKTGKVVRPPFRRSCLPCHPPGKGPKGGNKPPGGAPKAPYKEKNHKICTLLSKMSDLLESSDNGSDEDHENDNNADADVQHNDADEEVKGASSAFFSSLLLGYQKSRQWVILVLMNAYLFKCPKSISSLLPASLPTAVVPSCSTSWRPPGT